MSDAYARHIDTDVHTLVQLCGYSPAHARAELTAISHRERVGLISAGAALELLAQATAFGVDADPAAARVQWQQILRGSGATGHTLAA
ncbi:hypothetical protein QMK17_24040 [Rhodococcus sp. G-MC3]|uniref:hypothetical protein n=1 Tax=Rhodococcus sp. G-MC3 TaxID=3046209 RepID=UPI0024B91998|nr:hypothetical protein [Rhodococcus sp. G-MC3]MDJ0396381.1 hypothetical protein [Rhodococcus sp. G-MC3]